MPFLGMRDLRLRVAECLNPDLMNTTRESWSLTAGTEDRLQRACSYL